MNQTPTTIDHTIKGGLDKSSPYTKSNRYKINHGGFDESNPYNNRSYNQRWV
jgi:hypothetical protein